MPPRSRRRLVRSMGSLLVALIVALIVPLAMAGSAGATVVDDERAFHELVNYARGQNGLAGLTRDSAADSVARTWTASMIRSGTLSHNPNLVAEVERDVTLQWSRLGENVGVGWDVWSLHNAFMNSPGHRANVLGDYNRVGIGALRGGDGRLWVTFVFIKGPAISPASIVPASTFIPFADAASFARQQYLDILGREPDAEGIAHWQRLLESGSVSTGDLGAAFLASPEFGGVVAPITRLYFAALHRTPDVPGVRYWVGRVRGGMQLVDVARAFASSQEFATATNGLSPSDVVSLVYRSVLSREPDPQGLSYWVSLLDTNKIDEGQLLLQFAESAEFVYAVRFGVTTAMAYVTLLQRGTDAAGFTYWVDQFWRGTAPSLLVGSFYKSAEYAMRFG